MLVDRGRSGGKPNPNEAPGKGGGKSTVLAVLPRTPWVKRLLEEACNGRYDVVRTTPPLGRRRLPAHLEPAVIVWACCGSSDGDTRHPDALAGLVDLRAAKARFPAAEVIVLVDDHERVPLKTYCELVLMGVRSLVDARRPDAAAVLSARLEECLVIHEEERRAREALRASPLLRDVGLVGEALVESGVMPLVERAALLSDVPVLITGETGTGKRLLAEAIHRLDEKRREGPLLVVNCAAIAHDLAESALFGHARGAFTGADTPRQGYFRAADGGTLFLDEISELPEALQAKLLRVLEAGRVMPVGEDTEQPVDVRVVAATNRDLTEMMEQGAFRADLYHRLAIIRIDVPPLRERPGDIPALVNHFLAKYAHYYRGRVETVEPEVIRLLSALPNPGNVRELENIIRYSLLAKRAGSVLQLSDLPPGLVRAGAAVEAAPPSDDLAAHFARLIRQREMSLTEMVEHCEQMILSTALKLTSQNRTRAAQLLRTTRRTIQNKLLKYRLQ